MIDVSHLVAFLAGTAAGAAGTYMADRFTDQRRKQTAHQEADEKFEGVRTKMPELLKEIKVDLGRDECSTFRELVVLPTERTQFNHDKGRLEYYESAHPHAKNQIALLEAVGYIHNVSTTSWPIYRMSEDFVQLVLKQK